MLCEAEQGRADKGRRVHVDVLYVCMCVRQVCFEWLKLDDRCTRYVSVGTRQGNERGISIGGWPGRLCMYETSRPFPTGDMPGGQGMHGMSGVSMMDPSRSARSLLSNLRLVAWASYVVDHGLRHLSR